MDNSRTVPHARETDPQQQFIHLVRLAWDLRWLGLEISIELPRTREPSVLLRQASGPLRVTASKRGGEWIFKWGRGRNQWAAALDPEAPHRIRQVAR